ncbi:NO-inducible flavohemoprotein [Cytobacillus depressus]|uniref:Flavohemoprotein n=1 Tax=Cytobacillus depressus TaxID=1602942 RepID=A0A6L3V1U2_9BACI|nr:NO-inducible flavohemoprotein [Cytobacillus depressus]KAB2332114.1 NO-inducible flavohemoprotein [Cytobacillus depressus]
MLDQQTIEIIKSTVPVLEKHGESITTRFYELLFSNHPELLNIFNHANQKQGRQQTALANAVYAAAANIDKLEAIIPVVKQIGHKHRGLGVQPEHYPIVGETLLRAIQDVLGDAATDKIIDAWAKAYNVIAQAFIDVEQGMYQEAKEQSGGWEGFRNFIVDKKVTESDVITSFYLLPEDGGSIATFKPGQYITLKVQPESEKNTQLRQYSLSDAPGKNYYRISVKREDECKNMPPGIVSNYLQQTVQAGDILQVSAPAGDFVLDTSTESPVVLISGGVGLTPMMCMLNTLMEQNSKREVFFIHAARNGKVHALKEHVKQLANEHSNMKSYVCYAEPTNEDRTEKSFDKEGFIDLEWLKSIVPSNHADFYFCGPTPFMKTVYRILKDFGVAPEHIRYEFFGPAGSLEESSIA